MRPAPLVLVLALSLGGCPRPGPTAPAAPSAVSPPASGTPASAGETESERVALAFAHALMRGDDAAAHALLAPALASTTSPRTLRAEYSSMIGYGGGPITSAEVMNTMALWPDRQPDDLGWVYVSLLGDGYVEAVTVVVSRVGSDRRIRHLEWGRP